MIEDFGGTQRFRVIRPLGRGGMGAVYEAHDREHDEVVALKTLRHTSAQYLYFLKKEFRILQGVHHPNLVRLGELIEDRGRWFFTMELIRGADLLSYVRRVPRPRGKSKEVAEADTLAAAETGGTRSVVASPSPPFGGTAFDPMMLAGIPTLAHSTGDDDGRRPGWFDEARLRKSLLGAIDGLSALHEAGLIHRDVKPSNLMVAEDGRVVVLDFGLVHVRRRRGESWDDPLQLMGTPGYMAPEQYTGSAVTPASDWYSVGATLYEALTGRLPYQGTIVQILEETRAESALLPSELVEGVPPDLDELCATLLAYDPADRPDEGEIRRLLGSRRMSSHPLWFERPSAARFVGRTAELATLRQAFADTRGGAPVALFVEGASGIGKSALVDAFCDALLSAGDPVLLRGRCYERESVPYKAFDSLIDDLAAYLKGRTRDQRRALWPGRADALARLFPVLAIDGEVIPDEADRHPQELRTRAFGALKELLSNIAARHELVLFIDDLQWGDADSAALLAELLRSPGAPAMLLVGTYRSENADDPMVRDVVDDRAVIRLPPLSQDESRVLVAAMADELGPAIVELADDISREAKGSPFYLGEIVRHVSAHAGVELRAAGDDAPLLQRVITDRVAQLPGEARELLRIASVIARPVEPQLLIEASGLERGPGRRALQDLVASRMLRTLPRGQVEVYHDRLREAVSSQLAPGDVRAIYDRVATALADAQWERADVLGLDFIASRDPARALGYARRAARQAERALAFDRAARLYDLAAQLTTAKDERRELRRRYADALRYGGYTADAARAYLGLADSALPDDARELTRLAADSLLRSGHVEEGLARFADFARQLGVSLGRGRRSVLAAIAANRVKIALRGTRVRAPVDEAACDPRALDELDSLFRAATALGMVDYLRGTVLQTEHLLRALALGETRRTCRALAAEVPFLAAMGGRRLRRAASLSREVMLQAEKLDDPYLIASAYVGQGYLHFFTGAYPKAAPSFRAAMTHFEQCADAGWERTAASYWYHLVTASCGNFNALADSVPAEIRAAEERSDRHARGVFRGHPMVWLMLRDDRADEVEAELDVGLEGWPRDAHYQVHYVAQIGRAMARRYRGDAAGARDALRAAEPIARDLLITRMPYIYSEVHKLTGQTAIALDEPAVVRRAIRPLLRFGAPIARAYAASMRAWLARRDGRASDARELLLEAVRLFDESGAAHDAAAFRYRAGRLIGGARGNRLVGEALHWMEAQGVRNPLKMIDYLAPGL